jgi:hypothetical protein
MTIIKSPSSNSQRISSTSSSDLSITAPPTTVTNEDITNNGKFFKNKVTAAFNHMKYRKSNHLI